MTTYDVDCRAKISEGVKKERRRKIGGYKRSVEEEGMLDAIILCSLNAAGFSNGNNCA